MNVRTLAGSVVSFSPRALLGAAVLTALALGLAMSVEAATTGVPADGVTTTERVLESGELTYRVPEIDPDTGTPTGEVLEMGGAGYLTTIGPRVELAFAWARADGAPTTAYATLVAVARADRGWHLEIPLGEATTRNAENVYLEAKLDFAALDRALTQASETKGRPGILSWSLVALVKAGDSAESSRYAWPFRLDEPLYVLHKASEARQEKTASERHVTTGPPHAGLDGLAREPWRAALALAGLGGTALVLAPRPEGAA